MDVAEHKYYNEICEWCGYHQALESAEYVTDDGWIIALANEQAFLMTYVGDGKEMRFPSYYNDIPLDFDYFAFDYKKVQNTLEILWICNGYVCEIKPYQFHSFPVLKNAILGNGVTSIGMEAFGLCRNLQSVTIGEGVKFIGTFAFDQCVGLNSVQYNAVRVDEVEDMAPFEYCSWNSEDIIVTVGDKVEVLPYWLFGSWGPDASSAPKITEIKISASSNLQVIESYCFRDCTYIKTIFLPKTINLIAANAFENCGVNVIYYDGTISDWNKVNIEGGNEAIQNSTIYFYSSTEPVDEGNYWYYDESGNITIWQ